MISVLLPHLFLSTQTTSSFPVVGTPSSAFIASIFILIGALILYFIIERLPKPKKNRISSRTEPVLAKTMIALITLSNISASWDVWWHRAVGRDSFWVPPHLALYSFIILATIVAFYVWLHSNNPTWKRIAFLGLMVPVIGAFDNFFHTLWGVEDYTRPVRLAWSPGHAALTILVIAIFILLLKVLTKYRKTADFNFFANLAFASIALSAIFLVMPFHPTEGFGQVIRFAGAGVVAAVFIFIALAVQKIVRGNIDATQMTIFMIILSLVSYGKETAQQVIITAHDRPPVWLFIFAYLIAAILLDLTKNRLPLILRTTLVGIIWAEVLFGLSTFFFAPQFQYGYLQIIAAIISGAIGGFVVGLVWQVLDQEVLAKIA